MIHTFDRAGIERLLAHTLEAPEHRTLYEDLATEKPGCWIVGDDGVYMMSNGRPFLKRDLREGEVRDTPPNFVVYAAEVNPMTMAFDAWWAAKGAGFGRDDGVEFLPATDIQAALRTYPPDAPLRIDITPKSIAILYHVPPRPARKRLKKR